MSLLSAIDLTYTENSSLTHRSSNNPLINLFFTSGALRNETEERIITIFKSACRYDLEKAVRLLFYARDIRFGQGERRLFGICLHFLARHKSYQQMINKQFIYWIAEYGRWDDTLVLVQTPVQHVLIDILNIELLEKQNMLCAKWMPREKSSKKKTAAFLRRALGLTQKQYRKTLSTCSNVVESQMCSHDWKDIKFENVPGQAMMNYINCFMKHDPEGYMAYIQNVAQGHTKINAKTLLPHQLIEKYNKSIWGDHSEYFVDVLWKNLPDFLKGIKNDKILPVVDTSGSMWCGTPRCIDVSVGLGLYLAERNVGIFQDHFITFSESPQLQKIEGLTFTERFKCVNGSKWGMNTDLEAVFDLILQRAQICDIKQEEMPNSILILSDMEFDEACKNGHTVFESIRAKYKKSKYTIPTLVFWNLMSRHDNFPVQANEDGLILMSGFSASTLRYIFGEETEITETENTTAQTSTINPIVAMNKVIQSERYNNIIINYPSQKQ